MRCPTGRLFEPTRVFPVYGLPSYLSSSGFGSKVSTWDGAPFMNRKTTCLALAGKWDSFGESGPAFSPARAKNPSRVSKSMRASPANPPPARRRNSRREVIGQCGCGFTAVSLRIRELIQVEHDPAELLAGRPPAPGLLQECPHPLDLAIRRRSAQGQPIGQVDLLPLVRSGLGFQSVGQVPGLAVDELAVEERQGLGGDRGRRSLGGAPS